jgi:hypothetical protein
MSRKVVLALSLFALSALPGFAGFHYMAVTTVDGEGGEMGSFNVEAWIDGGNAKILFVESGNPFMTQGTYLLTTDGGQNLYLVNPEEKTYSKWDISGMMGALGQMGEAMGGMFKMEFSEPQVEKLLEESGGTILGYPTTHYRYRTSYSMEMKMMGMKRGDQHVTEQDIWSTTALDDEGFSVWLRNAPRSTGFESFDKLLEAEYSKVQGFPLKSVSRTTMTGLDKSNRTSTSTTTTEVTLLEETSVPASTFDLDPTYQEVSLMPTAESMPQAGEMGAEEEEEEQGGFFKRMKKEAGG